MTEQEKAALRMQCAEIVARQYPHESLEDFLKAAQAIYEFVVDKKNAVD